METAFGARKMAQKFWPYLDFRRAPARSRPPRKMISEKPSHPYGELKATSYKAPPDPHAPSLPHSPTFQTLFRPPSPLLGLRLAPATHAAASDRQLRLLGAHRISNYG